MPLPLLVKTLAEKKINAFCMKRVPEHILDKVRLSYKFRGNSVTIFENRAPWREGMKEWSSLAVAQMRYEEKTGKWTLYCADRNDKWHEYYDIDSTKDIDKLLREIDEDPTGIFWG
jgi:hypothetical protein